jgi:hypothetical protein
MKMDENTVKAVAAMETQVNDARRMAFVWVMAIVVTLVASVQIYLSVSLHQYTGLSLLIALAIVIGFSGVKGWSHGWLSNNKSRMLKVFHSGLERLSEAEMGGTAAALVAAVKSIQAEENPLLQSLMQNRQDYINGLIESRFRVELEKQLADEIKKYEQQCLQKATDLRNQHPLYKAYYALEAAEKYLKQRRVEIKDHWDEAMSKTSWWNQLMNFGSLDVRDLDNKIREFCVAKEVLIRKHENEFDQLNNHYGELAKQAFERVAKTKVYAEKVIQQCNYDDTIGNEVLKRSFFLASLSVPVSLWSDVSSAGDIYDVLRSVNGNYAGMSDMEVWWETLFLQPESLSGLISLTKGAYLERLVASDTGGQLFEHFNHPDTDIVIDGVAFQIKATDSVDYIHSVADGIPVIATTEVANLTDAIDSGYTNDELREAVSLAVGGAVIDVGDTAVDAILTGVGGLGVLATLNGISHTVKQHENGGDLVEAMFEGAGVAIEGTARAAVNTLELGYKVLTSRPSRFVGRGLVKIFIALDNKLMGVTESDKKNDGQ